MKLSKKKLTGREQRMKHFKEMQSGAGISLVSLMDIFTILVFFLLANSGAQQIPSRKDVKLPVSIATKAPGENLVITVTRDSILVQGSLRLPLRCANQLGASSPYFGFSTHPSPYASFHPAC